MVREQDILAEALDQIRSRLPTGWQLKPAGRPDRRARLNAMVRLISAQGQEVRFVVEVKRSLVTRDLPAVLDQLTSAIAGGLPVGMDTHGALPLVVSRYLPAPLQAWLTERNIAYADAAGNLRLAVDRPALFLRDVGAGKDPWRGPGRPKANLAGEPAARVVRALLDYAPPYSVPRLVQLSRSRPTSPPAGFRPC